MAKLLTNTELKALLLKDVHDLTPSDIDDIQTHLDRRKVIRHNDANRASEQALNAIFTDVLAAAATQSALVAGTGPDYGLGESIEITVKFSEVVTVTGSPRVALTLTSGAVYLTYASGSGSDTLTFRYTVLAPDASLAGTVACSGAINLNSGTIKTAAQITPTLGFVPPDMAAVVVHGS